MKRGLLRIGLFCALGCAGSACSGRDVALAESITAGNVARGRHAFRARGCGSCHEIDGNRTTQGHAGPALNKFALQSYLPGGLANEPDSLVHWLRVPRHVVPSTAMPELGLGEQEARDVAAYLYTLR
jgi:cytochrome c2